MKYMKPHAVKIIYLMLYLEWLKLVGFSWSSIFCLFWFLSLSVFQRTRYAFQCRFVLHLTEE